MVVTMQNYDIDVLMVDIITRVLHIEAQAVLSKVIFEDEDGDICKVATIACRKWLEKYGVSITHGYDTKAEDELIDIYTAQFKMPERTIKMSRGRVLLFDGQEWQYGVPVLMNYMKSFTEEFQHEIFDEVQMPLAARGI